VHTVIVTFTLDGLDDAAFRAAAEEAAPAFAGVAGLSLKLWLADAESGTYGGVYLFETAEAADEYLASELFAAAVTSNPRFTDVAIRRAGVLERPTAHTSRALRRPAATV
jgi:Putative mono-oxygenase ydhR